MKTKKKLTSVYLEEKTHKKIQLLSEKLKDESFSSLLRKIINEGLKFYA